MTDQSKIRNFSIIAHIDHGKSTLSDRLIEKCNAVSQREMESQLLDSMDLERERGITIKARAVKLNYQAADGETYELNLIDTPGHVDCNYVVSRSLAACEGAVLIVDAAQGIEAQTLANTFLALEHDLEILPVINKIDLPAADPQRVKDEIENIIGLPAQDAPEISAKVGLNIDAVLEDIVKNVPAPKGDPEAPLRALIFDSQYDAYRGVIVYFRVMEGTIKTGMRVKMMASGASYEVLECGHLLPLGMEPCGELIAGEVGYFTASIKNVKDTQVGDTVTEVGRPAAEPLPGYRPARAMVYCGIYTEDGSKYPDLRDALEKLQLNDASLSFEPESSAALGFGFRCGFLGMLHMEIIQERLEREFDLDLVTTLPSVIYEITKTDGAVVNGVLTLPIEATATALPNDVAAPTANPWTPSPLLAQPLRTGSMKVNPYMAFDPLPGSASLNPALDRWTETQTNWTSAITQRFDVSRDGYFHIVVDRQTSTATETVGSATSQLEYLREIDVAYRIEGFGAGEQLASATFDGVPLDLHGTADGNGTLDGSFRIPAKVPSGAKAVTFTGKVRSRS